MFGFSFCCDMLLRKHRGLTFCLTNDDQNYFCTSQSSLLVVYASQVFFVTPIRSIHINFRYEKCTKMHTTYIINRNIQGDADLTI